MDSTSVVRGDFGRKWSATITKRGITNRAVKTGRLVNRRRIDYPALQGKPLDAILLPHGRVCALPPSRLHEVKNGWHRLSRPLRILSGPINQARQKGRQA